MKILKEIVIILGSLAISIVAGCFLYSFIEDIRLDLYCKEIREGFDCYQEGWVVFPIWLFSLVGSFIAILSITIVSIVSSSSRVRSSKITLGIGSALALPLTLMIAGPIAFLATVLSGFLALLAVLRLTRCPSKDALAHRLVG